VLGGSTHQQLSRELRGRILSSQRLLVAKRQAEHRRHRVTARLLRQQHDLRPAGQRQPAKTAFDVGRRGIERFSR
jgi:hypothetical protein